MSEQNPLMVLCDCVPFSKVAASFPVSQKDHSEKANTNENSSQVIQKNPPEMVCRKKNELLSGGQKKWKDNEVEMRPQSCVLLASWEIKQVLA